VRSRPAPTNSLARRRRRMIGAVPAAFAVWVVIGGIPLSAPAPEAGTLDSQTIRITGTNADATPAASGGVEVGPTRSRSSIPTTVTAGWTASVDVTNGSQAIGVTWTGSPTGEVEIRGLGASGWTAWNEIHANPTEGPDGTGRRISEDQDGEGSGDDTSGDLVWFGGGVDRVELRVASGPLSDVTIEAMQYRPPQDPTTWQTAFQMPVAGAADTKPAIRPRSEWETEGWAYENDDCGSGPKTAAGGVKYGVVHHTVNANTYSQADVPGMLASIYRFHTQSRGWCDIAYNFVIDRFGRIWEGRTGSIEGAIVGGHATGFNTNSVGVSFLGQHNPGDTPAAVAPTSAQLDAAGQVIGWKLGQNAMPASGTVTAPDGSTIKRIVGHRDVGSTSCPGDLLWSQLETIRTKATSVAAGTTPTIPTATTTTSRSSTTTQPNEPSKPLGPFATPAQLVTQSYQDLLRRKPNTNELNLASAAIAGGQKAEVFLANLVSGTEMDTNVRQPIRLYRAYFLRNPDQAGLEFWVQKRRSGWSLNKISDNFAASNEFRQRYGALNSVQFVDLVYRNVLGRSPDANGRAYWEAKLKAGMSRGQVMTGFSESPEYKTATTAGVTVVALYDGTVKRTIPQGTYDYLEPRLRNGTTDISGVARYFMDKPEYHARFK
jgi:hypothetical protein